MGIAARLAAGFVIALCCTPAGISGAFLLLPVQMQVFGVPSPTVTATNLVYNLVATPPGALAYRRDRRLDGRLAITLIAGTTPGVIVGAVLRSTLLADPGRFAWVAGLLLLALGGRLLFEATRRRDARPDERDATAVPVWRLVVIGTVGGTIGGIYGLGGSAIIIPWLAGIERVSMRQLAGAGLATTFATSLVGVATFIASAWLSVGSATGPDWSTGIALGVGGAVGAVVGARLQPRVPVRFLQGLLGLIAVVASLRTFG